MVHMVGLTFGLTGYLRADEETQTFVAFCPSLDIYTAAQTRDEIEPAMRSAAKMFIRLCYERGILEQVLHKQGFLSQRSTTDDVPTLPHGADFIAVKESLGTFEESFPFDVPMPLVSDQLSVGMRA